jgi:hypothetical protein
MSLYEVAEVKPGVGLVLRDLVRGGGPVEVDERLGSERLVRWDRIGARVLKVGGRRCLSGAVLRFPHEVSEIVLRCFGRCAAGLGELEQRVAPVLESNSRQRAERGRTLLKELLGELVDAPLLSLQSVAGMLEAHGGRQEAGRQKDGAGIPRSELERIEREFLDRQYRRTLDEPVPMLGNVAPRAAVETAAGKQRVVEWLKYLENCEGRRARDTGGGPYDFTWMWRELGIAGERR